MEVSELRNNDGSREGYLDGDEDITVDDVQGVVPGPFFSSSRPATANYCPRESFRHFPLHEPTTDKLMLLFLRCNPSLEHQLEENK